MIYRGFDIGDDEAADGKRDAVASWYDSDDYAMRWCDLCTQHVYGLATHLVEQHGFSESHAVDLVTMGWRV